MKKTIKQELQLKPAVLLVRGAVFAPGRGKPLRQVQSRMLLWCRAGKGMVRVNNELYCLCTGNFLLLPWEHVISYQNKGEGPWHLEGIHIVPCMKQAIIHYEISHVEPGLPHRFQGRYDVPLPGLDGIVAGSFSRARELEALADYLVLAFQRGPDERLARRMGEQILDEMIRVSSLPSLIEQAIPGKLQRMLTSVKTHLSDSYGIPELATVGNCSHATVNRLFRRFLEKPPLQYVLEAKINKAADLLTATTLSAREVGEQVGISDPYYFSRLFRKIRGITTTEHRRRSIII